MALLSKELGRKFMRGRGYKEKHAKRQSDFFLHSFREDVTMARKNVADLLVDVLAETGVQRIYGVSGDSLNGITDSIRTSNDSVDSRKA